MQKWEYKVVTKYGVEYDPVDIEKFLNDQGELGWELTSVCELRWDDDTDIMTGVREYTLYFKRTDDTIRVDLDSGKQS